MASSGGARDSTSLKPSLETTLSFLAENAWEEIEAWVLAGLNLPSDWSWAEVRAEGRRQGDDTSSHLADSAWLYQARPVPRSKASWQKRPRANFDNYPHEVSRGF